MEHFDPDDSSTTDDQDASVLTVAEVRAWYAAMDDADGDADDVALKRKAVTDAVKQKGAIEAAFKSVHKLRSKPRAYAKAYLLAITMFADIAGLNEPLTVEGDGPSPTFN